MTLISIGIMLIFIISMIWTWHNLGHIEKPKKILFIIIGWGIIYLLTICLYHFASPDVIYPSEEMQKTVSGTLISIFTGLNGLIFLPFVANLTDKVLEEEIEKSQVKRKIVIILIIFVVCIFVEKGYMESTQEGIMNIYNEVQNAEK